MLQTLHLIVKNMVQQATIFVTVIVVFVCFISPTYAKANNMRLAVPYCNTGSDPCITPFVDSPPTQVKLSWSMAGHIHDKIQIRYKVVDPTLLRDWDTPQLDLPLQTHSDYTLDFYPDAVYSIIAQTCDTHTVGKDDCYGWTSPAARVWTGPHAVYGAILDEYEATGLMNGSLGAPTSDEEWAGKQKGRYNFFEKGAIFWRTGDTFANAVFNDQFGDIYQVWTDLGRENGKLGFPTADRDQTDTTGSNWVQSFECGHIYARGGKTNTTYQPGCTTVVGFKN